MRTIASTLIVLFVIINHSLSQENGRYESLEEALKEPDKVLSLELWGSDHVLTELPRCIKKFKNVKSIVLRGNNLTQLPRSFSKLSNLEELSLGNNKNLDHAQVCKILSKLPKLRQLDFEATGLNDIPKEMLLLKHLEELFIGLNGIEPRVIEQLKKEMQDVKIFD